MKFNFAKKNLLLFVLLSLFVISCGGDDGNKVVEPDMKPTITSITPASFYASDEFRVFGTNFGSTQATFNATVKIGDSTLKANEIKAWTDTLITLQKGNMPAGNYDLAVKTDNGQATGKVSIISYEQELPFSITNIYPTSITLNSTLSIAGEQLGATQGSSYVMLGSSKITTAVSWSNKEVKVNVPDLGQTGKYYVSIVKDNVESNKIEVNYTAPVVSHVINFIEPTTAKIGDEVTIHGSSFGATRGSNYVTIGNVKVTEYTSWASNEIKIKVPSGAASDSLYVVIDNARSNGRFITINTSTADPVITKLDKAEYPQNGLVRISGTDFGSITGKILCYPDDLEAAPNDIVTWDDTLIRFQLPGTARSGELCIITKDGKKSNKIQYYVKIDDSYTMVLIPKGEFTMGRDGDEYASPSHKVTLTRDFYMSESAVTQKQYEAITKKNPFPTRGDNLPANHVTFADACNFCNELSKLKLLQPCYTIVGNNVTCDFTANGYRLPTEAEWEYAAKGGLDNDLGFAGTISTYAWYSVNSGTSGQPKEVKKLVANPYKLYDMLGNVDEWVWDNFNIDYQQYAGGATDPTGITQDGGVKVVRGGNISSGAEKIKVYVRGSFNQSDKNYNVGFRYIRIR